MESIEQDSAGSSKSSLRTAEEQCAKKNLQNVTVDSNYIYGYFNGDRDVLDNVIEQFQLVSSTCFVLAENHSKEKDHKRFSQTGTVAVRITVLPELLTIGSNVYNTIKQNCF